LEFNFGDGSNDLGDFRKAQLGRETGIKMT